MIKVLIDENFSEYLAEGLNIIQSPLGNKIEVTSITKQYYKGIKDEDWIPDWGSQKGIFITQDVKIVKTHQQAELLKKYKLGAFFIKVPNGCRYWQIVEFVFKQWPQIVKVIQTEKKLPYAYLVTSRSFKKII
jgi:hypothetical protein